MTVGPPGTGKSRGVGVWNLLRYPSSMLVTDPKGELAGWSAAHRAGKLRQNVAVLDPFGITGFESAAVNPLASVVRAVRSGREFRDEAGKLAHLLLPDLPGDKDPYWRGGARDLITTALLYLAALKPEECSLPSLHGVLWRDDVGFMAVLQEMAKATGGPAEAALREYAADSKAAMAAGEGKHFSYFRREARQALAIFAADSACGAASRETTLDFEGLLSGNMTVYLVLPAHMIASHGRWMGLVVEHAVSEIARSKLSGDCVFLLDEFPNLGRLPSIPAAIAQLRWKGLRVWLFIQELAQLESVYGKADAENMRGQAEVLQVLGCRSRELAEFIEARAGIYIDRDVKFSLPSPLDPNDVPRSSIEDIEVPHIRASDALNMGRFEQILIRAGYPVIWADVPIWRGDTS